MRYFVSVSLMFISLVWQQPSFAQMTGMIKKNFVQNFQKSCLANQRTNAANAQVSDADLVKYCRCASEYVADLMNNEMVMAIEAGQMKFDIGTIQLAQKYCSVNYDKY